MAMVVHGTVGDVWADDATRPDPSQRSQLQELALRLKSEGNTDPDKDKATACSKVRLSAFTPSAFSQSNNNTEVAPKSAFSFLASEATFPISITVTIKDQSVPITVTPNKNKIGFKVTGKLPNTVNGTFARINITVKGPNCEGKDGWLLKVAN
jgi:hypothetical protein